LLNSARNVKFEDGAQRAKEWRCEYMETSAKTKQNVEDVYKNLLRKIKARKQAVEDAEKRGRKLKGKCIIL